MGTQSSDILEINTATSESKVRGREERGREGGREGEREREREGRKVGRERGREGERGGGEREKLRDDSIWNGWVD